VPESIGGCAQGVFGRAGFRGNFRSTNLRTAATLTLGVVVLIEDQQMCNDSCNPSVKLFSVRPEANTEALLANAYETIAGAGAMTHEFAETLPSQQRYLALAIQQMIELGLMLVEAAQDRVDQAAQVVWRTE